MRRTVLSFVGGLRVKPISVWSGARPPFSRLRLAQPDSSLGVLRSGFLSAYRCDHLL